MDEYLVEKSIDLRGKSIEILTPEDLPPKVQDIYLSNNKISKLPNDIFFTKSRVWNIYLDYNLLSDLKFITCFQYLGTLDVRHNSLELDDILELRKIHILYLYIEDNNFQRFTNSYPLTIPALLKRAWTIDGYFITDFIRRKAKEFKKTKQFGETVLMARKDPIPFHQQESISNMAKSFLGGTKCKFYDPSRFLNSTGINVEFLTKKPQIDRLSYLTTQAKYTIPEGEFFDLFAITLGILSEHWCGYPKHIIPRFLSRGYWSTVSEQFTKIENWIEFLILNQIDHKIAPKSDRDIEIWSRLNMRKYLQHGLIPPIGTFPRLLISSIVYRSEELNGQILESEDMKIYVKFRNSFDFGPADRDFDVICDELLMDIPCESTVRPRKGDSVSIRHPFHNEWTSCEVFELINGRAILKVDNEFLQPIALESLFWDGRGLFREKQKIEEERKKASDVLDEEDENFLYDKRSPRIKRRTFITVADTIEDSESTKQDVEKFSIPLPPCAIPSTSILPRNDPSIFLRTSQIQSALSSRRPLFSTPNANINVNVNEPKLVSMKLNPTTIKNNRKSVQFNLSNPRKKIDKEANKKIASSSSSFRGIVDPVPRRQKKIFARKQSTRKKPAQVVDCVVNITLGAEVADFRRIRIFHVRVINTITKKYSYVNVKEDEISEEDAERLIELYKQHIESKIMIIPGE